MSNQRLRLLYLNDALPSGMGGRFPFINPAGHQTDTRMAQALQYSLCITWLPVVRGQDNLVNLY